CAAPANPSRIRIKAKRYGTAGLPCSFLWAKPCIEMFTKGQPWAQLRLRRWRRRSVMASMQLQVLGRVQ
ncbi:MAG TPA: hypothetical protein VEQ35_03990, partial [Beijerinckia sp.]|nr:hypothetical protein [Beijerinckia sp.]